MNNLNELASTSSDEDFLNLLRIDVSSASNTLSVDKILQHVPIRKPEKSSFIRVHPKYALDCYMVEIKDRQETYLVSPNLIDYVLGLAVPVRLRLAITKQGALFIWPIKLPKDDRKVDAWSQSASDAASLAEGRWVRVAADMSLGAYQPYAARGDLAEPKWPPESWSAILKIATRNRLIEDQDHPVIREIQGLA